MAYDLIQFIADCRDCLARDPGPAGREYVRVNLERLLANKDFVEEYCGDTVPRGLKVLYEDPKLGFQILAHINDKARVSPPHDHGASWAIYGQATKYTDMIEWEREDDGADPKHAKLKPFKKYRLTPGKAGIYQDGAIHSIDYPDYARPISTRLIASRSISTPAPSRKCTHSKRRDFEPSSLRSRLANRTALMTWMAGPNPVIMWRNSCRRN